jgi:hypothetical protein
MNRELTVSAVLALFIVGMAFSGAAQDGNTQVLEDNNEINSSDSDVYQNESSNITVTVNSKTQIDVKPEELNFPSMDVGTQEVESSNGNNGFGALEIENIGSEYIDRVWVNATAPSSDPFGTGDPTNYDAGNFLQVKPSNESSKVSVRGNSSTYHFVNRYEFTTAWSSSGGEIPSYIEADPSNIDNGGTPSETYVGRLSAGDQWYFYVIATGSSNDVCDGTGSAIMRLGNTSHSPDQFGTVDFTESGPNDWREYEISQSTGDYGIVSGGPTSETGVRLNLTDSNDNSFYREYDMLTACDTADFASSDPHTIRTRYNVQAGDEEDLTAGTETGSRTQFLLEAGSASPGNMLLPGEGLTVDTAVEVPQGVPEGGVQNGEVTFFVTSDYDASV